MEAIVTPSNSFQDKIQSLKSRLSLQASIDLHTEDKFQATSQRWSDYKAPQPGAVVNVATEHDIEETVSWATSNNVKFVAQAGGHGWTTTFNIGRTDIVINLRKMKTVTIDASNGTATIEAGALNGEVIEEAYSDKVHLIAGGCNGVGAIGVCLGGGLARFQGLHGLGIDNMLSARLVTASGKAINVSPTEHSDLWWGIRGAGQNFGIVSKLVMKAYPQINDGMHWFGSIVFTPDKIQSICDAINNLNWNEGMALHMLFVPVPPEMKPAVLIVPWYPGPEDKARKAFSQILSLGPIFEQTAMTPWNHLNDGGAAFDLKGGYKPVYCASFASLDGPAISKIFELYSQLVSNHPDAAYSGVMFECFSQIKVLEVKNEETAYAHRDLGFHGLCLANYKDVESEGPVVEWGQKCRELMRGGDGSAKRVYMNFASGDERPEELYGKHLERLRELKTVWDKDRVFGQFNPV